MNSLSINSVKPVTPPRLGVVSVPYISSTPIQDVLYLKQKEFEAAQIKTKTKKNFIPKEVLYLFPVCGLGFLPLVRFFSKKHK